MINIVLLEMETFECRLERGVGISLMNISGRHIQGERKDNTELEGISPDRNFFFFGGGYRVGIIGSENDEKRTH